VTLRHLLLFLLFLAALTPAASLLLWAIVLPVCFVFSAVLVCLDADTEFQPLQRGFSFELPSRGPPVVS
jgi:hypothetical protein